MELLWALLFLLALFVAWLTNVFGLPGNWLMVAAAAIYWILMPTDTSLAIGTTVLVLMAVLAILGELVELVAGSAGVSKAGGTRRGAVYAILGSFAGAMVGFFVGVPIPLIGPLVGSLLFGSVGAMAGAMYGERSAGRDWSQTVEIGRAAFWGRALGTVGKMAIGLAILSVALVGIIV